MTPEVAERAYYRQKVWKRVVVISAGPAVNVVLAFFILWGLYAATTLTFVQPVVEKVVAGSPAAEVLEARRPPRCPWTAARATRSASPPQDAPGARHGADGGDPLARLRGHAEGRLSRRDARRVRRAPRRAPAEPRGRPALRAADGSGGGGGAPHRRPARAHARRAAVRPPLRRFRTAGGGELWRRDDVEGHDDDRPVDRASSSTTRRRATRSPASWAPTRRPASPSSSTSSRPSTSSGSSPCRSASSTSSRSCRSTAGTSSGRSPRSCAAARSRSASWSAPGSSASCSSCSSSTSG